MSGGARPAGRHLRDRTAGGGTVSYIELFFDLVYVFAITQLSHSLLGHLDLEGAWHTLVLLLVVWWAWIYTTWMANWFEPGSLPVRLILMAGMAASLVMAASLPEAFGDHGVVFAGAYLVLQVGRNAAASLLLSPADDPLRRTFHRLLVWSLVTAPLWLAGGFADESLRPALWGAALAIDLVGPIARYWVPGLGRARTTDWQIDGDHFAERFQLLLIIALGESIVVTGASAAEAGLGATTLLALGVAFAGTAALWWLYFDSIAEHARRDLAGHEDPGAIARDAYTYLHIPIFAGIILAAIGDELLIAHPGDELHLSGILVMLGGPALYLAGEALFRWRMVGQTSARRLIAVAALALLAVPATVLPALAVAASAVAVLIALAVAEFEPAPRPATTDPATATS